MVLARFYIILLVVAINSFLLISSAPLERRRKKGEVSKQPKGAKQFSGVGTFYYVGSGSCGKRDKDTELVVAMNKAQMDNGPNPNNNPQCDKMITITGDRGTATAKVVDTCSKCANRAIDMSPATFKRVCGNLSEGVCHVSWKFV